MATKKKSTKAAQPVVEVVAYKGFNKDWKCRDFQYKVGETYTHDGKVQICESGFHACEYPLDVFKYYDPTSKFAIVKASGAISREEQGDTKIASASLMIEAEISMPTLISKAIEWVMSRCTKEGASIETADKSHASNTGYQSAASNTGNQSAASNTGDYSAASNTGNYSAASNTGYQSAASNTGYQSAASVSGKESVAMASGYQGKAKASAGSAIVLVYRDDDYNLIHIRASKVGENGVKPDVWYSLDASGAFVEVE